MTTMEVGIRELKSRLSHYLDAVRKGEIVVITDRGKPIARIEPLASYELPPEFQRRTRAGLLVDKGPPRPLPSPTEMLPGQKTTLDYVREQRR